MQPHSPFDKTAPLMHAQLRTSPLEVQLASGDIFILYESDGFTVYTVVSDMSPIAIDLLNPNAPSKPIPIDRLLEKFAFPVRSSPTFCHGTADFVKIFFIGVSTDAMESVTVSLTVASAYFSRKYTRTKSLFEPMASVVPSEDRETTLPKFLSLLVPEKIPIFVQAGFDIQRHLLRSSKAFPPLHQPMAFLYSLNLIC